VISVISYGSGNVSAIQNMLRALNCESSVLTDPQPVVEPKALILPGIGSFDRCAKLLRSTGMFDYLQSTILNGKVPILGICLGFQLLTDGSEEGNEGGLGAIPGFARRFESRSDFRVPHMGWEETVVTREHYLFKNLEEKLRFYYAHSYYVVCNNEDDRVMSSIYDIEFTAAACKKNVIGVQFHPEKSHRFGKKILQNFVNNLAT